MPTEPSVEVRQFARVYVDNPGQLPPNAACYKSSEGSYYFTLNLEGVGVDDASSLVRKAHENFEVEIVSQVRENDRIVKERVYVENVNEVPEGKMPKRGPEGGVYYEVTDADQDPEVAGAEGSGPVEETVGYSNEPVLAIQFEDIDEGDKVAFETDDGNRDMGKVTEIHEDEHTVTVESGDGSTEVAAAPLGGEQEKSEGSGSDGSGTVTSDTAGVHNVVHSPDEDEEEEVEEVVGKTGEGHIYGDYMDSGLRLEEGEAYCESEGETFRTDEGDEVITTCPHCGESLGDSGEVPGPDGETGHLDKQSSEDVWTYYYGPEGGEGWMNMRTGDVVYQQQRPGRAPEDGDGYGDWLADGWGEAPDLETLEDELQPGQTVELYDNADEDYRTATVQEVTEDGVKVEEDEHGAELTVDGEGFLEISAYEEEYDPFQSGFEEWVEDVPVVDDLDEYYEHIHDEAPEYASEQAQSLEYGDEEYTLDLGTAEPTLPLAGYSDEELGAAGPAVSYVDLVEATSEEEVEEEVGPPEEVGPTITIPEGSITNLIQGESAIDVGDWEEPPEDLEPVDYLSEGDTVAYQSSTDDDWQEATIEVVGDSTVTTEDGSYLWSDTDVLVPESTDIDTEPPVDVDEGDTLEVEDEFVGDTFEVEVDHVTSDGEIMVDTSTTDAMDVDTVTGIASDWNIDTVDSAEPSGEPSVAEDAMGEEVETTDVETEEVEDEVGEGFEPDEPSDSHWENEHTAGVVEDDFSYEDAEEWGKLSDYHFPSGVSQKFMRVGVTDEYDGSGNEGMVFGNFYGGHSELGIDPAEHIDPSKEDLGRRQMATYHVGSALGGNIPDAHSPDGGDTVYMEGVEGENVGTAPQEYLDQVDPEEWYEQAGIQIICGNNDAHQQNVLVTPDGTPVFHDIDHSSGPINSSFTGNKSHQYDNALDRTLGELWSSAQHIVDDDMHTAKERMLEAAKQKAKEVAGPDGVKDEQAVEGLSQAKDIDYNMGQDIRQNIIDLANDNLDYDWK